MFAQLVQDFVGFEGRQYRFNGHRGLDASLRDAQVLLRKHEHVVPEPGLQMTFELGQVEIRTRSFGRQGGGIVVKEQAKIKQRTRHRFAVYGHVFLVQVPTAGADEQHGGRIAQAVGFCLFRHRQTQCCGLRHRAGCVGPVRSFAKRVRWNPQNRP